MKKSYKDHTPKISYLALGTLCFITLVMSQTRFKISKELSREITPPILRSRDCWFLYTIGNPDRFKCVLRAFVVTSSPAISLISTVLLLVGKRKSDPYFFIPWLFLTIKGLLLIQADNVVTILRDMAAKTNYTFGFRMEDVKWILFYFSIFLMDLAEIFSFCEVFDIFLVLWNHHPGHNVETISLKVLKKEIAEIMESFSRCSLGSLSKMSIGSLGEVYDYEAREVMSKLRLLEEIEKEGKEKETHITQKAIVELPQVKDMSLVENGKKDIPEEENEKTETKKEMTEADIINFFKEEISNLNKIEEESESFFDSETEIETGNESEYESENKTEDTNKDDDTSVKSSNKNSIIDQELVCA